jgi:hypothetical protein
MMSMPTFIGVIALDSPTIAFHAAMAASGLFLVLSFAGEQLHLGARYWLLVVGTLAASVMLNQVA